MLNENIKRLRKAKGLSQQELADRLCVTRQTISKWERGYSVPDSALLIELSEAFKVSVSDLLGSAMEMPEEENVIAQKLEQLNLLLAERNLRSRRIWKVVGGVLIGLLVVAILCIILNMAAAQSYSKPEVEVKQMEQQVLEK